MDDQKIWRICIAAAALLAVLTFTPLITPAGVYHPKWLGMPFTLWMGLVQSILLVVITWIGTRVHPGNKN